MCTDGELELATECGFYVQNVNPHLGTQRISLWNNIRWIAAKDTKETSKFLQTMQANKTRRLHYGTF